MTDAVPSRPVRGRVAKQIRSLETRASISAAAVTVIAERGISGVTHRLVAERAGVPLAATTYYYESKFDILAEAANASMQLYAAAFAKAAARYRANEGDVDSFRDFAFRLIRNAAGVHKAGTIAWAEIALDAVRHPESLVLARNWSAHINALWTSIAEALGARDARAVARSGIDTVAGLLFMTIALGLSEAELASIFECGGDPVQIWSAPRQIGAYEAGSSEKLGRKTQATRRRIVDAAIDILINDGPAAVNFRQIAKRAGLTAAAPAYHFKSVEDLLRVAQERLFGESKERYRRAVAAPGQRGGDLEQLADLTSVVFLREATEFGRQNLATFAIWLEAARRPELRPLVCDAIIDQCRAWRRLLDPLSTSPRPVNGLLAEAMFAGKLVRILSTGAATSDLISVRREFAQDLTSLADGGFWALQS
ncbi:MAG: TetR/AcrR family transcriptional regulator [Roseiarcus sp.]